MANESLVNVRSLKSVDIENTRSFVLDNKLYYCDQRIKTFLESALGVSLKAVYVNSEQRDARYELRPKRGELDWSNSTLVLFLENGGIVSMFNSECGFINIDKKGSKND